jgi:hypothetical protein
MRLQSRQNQRSPNQVALSYGVTSLISEPLVLRISGFWHCFPGLEGLQVWLKLGFGWLVALLLLLLLLSL